MDHVEQPHRLLGLVRLELADEVEADVGVIGDEPGPLRCRFLNPILAEAALAGGEQRQNRPGRMGLRHRDELDRRRIAPGAPRRAGDDGTNLGQPIGSRRVVGQKVKAVPR
jgi:hypothetical protein